MGSTLSGIVVVAALLTSCSSAFAWGSMGHQWISGVAVELLPKEVPAFIRTPEAIREIAAISSEVDRRQVSSEMHDKERDPSHFLYLDDSKRAGGIMLFDMLPETREEYDSLLRARGSTLYEAGYLPYCIYEGWGQLVRDFALWRVAVKGAETALTPEERAWFESDRQSREKLIRRDLGVWSHFVGDASQPLHVSVHVDGWGDYPNPEQFTNSKIHAYFEDVFVKQNVDREKVVARAREFSMASSPSVRLRTQALISEAWNAVRDLYVLEKLGYFAAGHEGAVTLATWRLAAGARAVRDLTYAAWLASAEQMVGNPQ